MSAPPAGGPGPVESVPAGRIRPRSMAMSLENTVRAALADLQDPHLERPLADTGALRGIGVDGEAVAIEVRLDYPAAGWHEVLAGEIRRRALAVPGVARATVSVAFRVHSHKVQNGLTPLPEVKNIIAVASGKGGVGKSTTAVNLALALQAEGARVAVPDAQNNGTSTLRWLGLEGGADRPDSMSISPLLVPGLLAMSLGLLVGEDTPMLWRSPLDTQALQQLLGDTRWQG